MAALTMVSLTGDPGRLFMSLVNRVDKMARDQVSSDGDWVVIVRPRVVRAVAPDLFAPSARVLLGVAPEALFRVF